MEVEFLRYYTNNMYQKVQQYIIDYNLFEEYNKSVKDKDELLKFGYYYGILPIVAFCYCILKCEVDIDKFVKRPLDIKYEKFKYRRQQCAEYLTNIKKYSRYTTKNNRFIYYIVEKYIEDYDLLNVQF